MPRTYAVRNDFVIVRVTRTGHAGKIAVSDRAEEGKVYTVVAFGPYVEFLKEGDRVLLFADQNTSFMGIPGESDLVVIKEANVSAVIDEESK